VDGIDAQIPWVAIGLGLPTFAETGDRRTGLLEVLANASVPGAVSEDIHRAHRDVRQSNILRLSEA